MFEHKKKSESKVIPHGSLVCMAMQATGRTSPARAMGHLFLKSPQSSGENRQMGTWKDSRQRSRSKCPLLGEPGWKSWWSVLLLVSTQVVISGL